MTTVAAARHSMPRAYARAPKIWRWFSVRSSTCSGEMKRSPSSFHSRTRPVMYMASFVASGGTPAVLLPEYPGPNTTIEPFHVYNSVPSPDRWVRN